MKVSFVSLLFALCFGIGAAYGQPSGSTAQPAGGTCSSYAAGCNLNCDQQETPSRQCHATCGNELDACMQTGNWHSDNGPDVPTQRQ